MPSNQSLGPVLHSTRHNGLAQARNIKEILPDLRCQLVRPPLRNPPYYPPYLTRTTIADAQSLIEFAHRTTLAYRFTAVSIRSPLTADTPTALADLRRIISISAWRPSGSEALWPPRGQEPQVLVLVAERNPADGTWAAYLGWMKPQGAEWGAEPLVLGATREPGAWVQGILETPVVGPYATVDLSLVDLVITLCWVRDAAARLGLNMFRR
ncbi:MAG: hypothetical protein M1829_005174 [Trizodia sp. TS-e1964]|nr:MAG: hypothetical protein M1829_005174 [Trizodia sp. TS-e1964]